MDPWLFLREFLNQTPSHIRTLTLSFKQIELIMRARLPPEAYKSNKEWLDFAGIPRTWGRLPAWRAGPVNVEEEWVTFTRIGP